MLEALTTGLILVFQWPAVGFLLIGCLLGVWIGAVPGLGGIIGLVLLLPFTFGMEPVPAMALLIGLWTVTATSDTIASVMLGIPGTAASQATILDGYPLAKKGQAGRAFGAAFTVSAFGGVFGAIMLAIALPVVLPVILAFNSPELFMLGMLGLTMVSSLSGTSVLKGLTAATFGLMLGTIGFAESEAIPRFTFGTLYLTDELPLIPVVLGLFAIPELLELAVRNVSISRIPKDEAEGGALMDGVRDAFRHWWLVIRCSAIGTYVGVIPGLGASIVDWIAYGHAVQSAKDKSQFGHGDIRGVIAPEAANNAIKGGALIPTLALGIPGSLGTAILLGALIMQGLRPGPNMLDANLHITFSLVWMIVVANIFAAGLLMIVSKQVAKIAFLPGHLVVPGVIVFVLMGAWLGGASIGDWVTCLTMGAVGYVMKRGGWPRPPLILALILGNILENSFQLSMRIHLGPSWLLRPIVLIIIALIVLTLIVAVWNVVKRRKDPQSQIAGEGSEKNPVISLPFATILVVMFAWMAIDSLQWPLEVKQFPLAVAMPATALALWCLWGDTKDLIGARRETGVLLLGGLSASEKTELAKAGLFFGYLVGIVLVTLVVGQKIALPLFIGIYLWRWGGYGWRLSVGYALAAWVFIAVFYDQLLHLVFHPFWLAPLLRSIFPDWFPSWIVI